LPVAHSTDGHRATSFSFDGTSAVGMRFPLDHHNGRMTMQIVGTQVHEDMGGVPGYTVEFVGDGGEVVSVRMKQSESGDLNRENALAKARVLLLQVATFDGTTKKERDDNLARSGDDAVSDAVLSARRAQDETELESQVDEGLLDTFPASDPVSATYSSTAGSKERH
jgi:hypothetical protein